MILKFAILRKLIGGKEINKITRVRFRRKKSSKWCPGNVKLLQLFSGSQADLESLLLCPFDLGADIS